MGIQVVCEHRFLMGRDELGDENASKLDIMIQKCRQYGVLQIRTLRRQACPFHARLMAESIR